MAVMRHKEAIHSGQFMVSDFEAEAEDEVDISPDGEGETEATSFRKVKRLMSSATSSPQRQVDEDDADNEEKLDNKGVGVYLVVSDEHTKNADMKQGSSSEFYRQSTIDGSQLKREKVDVRRPPKKKHHLYQPHQDQLNMVAQKRQKILTGSGGVGIRRPLIDVPLKTLLHSMSYAYRQKLTSPKWNRFRGLRLKWKDKIRLNNVIWRCWHMQFVKCSSKLMCDFANPLEISNHNSTEAGPLVQGKYWKKRLDTIKVEYMQWRRRSLVKMVEDRGQRAAKDNNLHGHPVTAPSVAVVGATGVSDLIGVGGGVVGAASTHCDKDWDILTRSPFPCHEGSKDDADIDGMFYDLDVFDFLVDDKFDFDALECNTAGLNVAAPADTSSSVNQVLSLSVFDAGGDDYRNATNADFIQPGLGPLQPNLDDLGVVEFGTNQSPWLPTQTVPFSQKPLHHQQHEDQKVVLDHQQVMTHLNTVENSQEDDGSHRSSVCQDFHPSLLTHPIQVSGQLESRAQILEQRDLSNTSSYPGNAMVSPDINRKMEESEFRPQKTSSYLLEKSCRGSIPPILQGMSSHKMRSPKYRVLRYKEHNEKNLSTPGMHTHQNGSATAYVQGSDRGYDQLRFNIGFSRSHEHSSPYPLHSIKGDSPSIKFSSAHQSGQLDDEMVVDNVDHSKSRTSSELVQLLKANGNWRVPLVHYSDGPHLKDERREETATDLSYGAHNKERMNISQQTFWIPVANRHLQHKPSAYCAPLEFSSVKVERDINRYGDICCYIPSPKSCDFQQSTVVETVSSMKSADPLNSFSGERIHQASKELKAKTEPRQCLRRSLHIHVEANRRHNLKYGFDFLKELVPSLNDPPNCSSSGNKVSKATILNKGGDYLRELCAQKAKVDKEESELKATRNSLESDVDLLMRELHDDGTGGVMDVALRSVSPDESVTNLFGNHVRRCATEANWKYWAFSQLIWPLFESFDRHVTASNGFESLARAASIWVQRCCHLPNLRAFLFSTLRKLSVESCIVDEPEKFAHESFSRAASLHPLSSKCSSVPHVSTTRNANR